MTTKRPPVLTLDLTDRAVMPLVLRSEALTGQLQYQHGMTDPVTAYRQALPDEFARSDFDQARREHAWDEVKGAVLTNPFLTNEERSQWLRELRRVFLVGLAGGVDAG